MGDGMILPGIQGQPKVLRALLTCLEVAEDSLSFCERDGWRAVSVAAAWVMGLFVGGLPSGKLT